MYLPNLKAFPKRVSVQIDLDDGNPLNITAANKISITEHLTKEWLHGIIFLF